MNETDRPARNPDPDRSQSDPNPLSPKQWIIIGVGLALGTVIWVFASVLTAKPYADQSVHADMVALANTQQPDPDAPSRYADLVDALMEFDAALDQVANEVVREEGYFGTGVKILDFSTVRVELDPNDQFYYERHLADAADVRRSVDVILERRLFDEVTRLLRSPNLGNGYPSAYDESGALLPMYEWSLQEFAYWRKFMLTPIGCARVLAERGETQRAASMLEHCDRIPGMLTRQAMLVEHLVGFAVADMIATEIEFIATRPDITPQSIATLRRSHERLSDFGDLAVAIQGEAVTLRDWHYRTHTAGGRYIPSVGEQITTSFSAVEPIGLKERLGDMTGYHLARRRASLAASKKLFQNYEAAAREHDPLERDRFITAALDSVSSLNDRYEFLKLMAPSLGPVILSHFKVQARITALDLLLHMAQYRLDHGDWPESLNQLIPHYLDAIPTDPLTGKPFEYNHTPGQPPSLERLGAGS